MCVCVRGGGIALTVYENKTFLLNAFDQDPSDNLKGVPSGDRRTLATQTMFWKNASFGSVFVAQQAKSGRNKRYIVAGRHRLYQPDARMWGIAQHTNT